jgi:hypothetical protein
MDIIIGGLKAYEKAFQMHHWVLVCNILLGLFGGLSPHVLDAKPLYFPW